MAKKVEQKTKDDCKLTVFNEIKNPNIIKLKEIYEQSRQKAKIIFDNNKSNNSYYESRICLFEYSNGDFRIVSMTRKYGVSISAVLYSRETNNWVISYKHKTKTFYVIDELKRVRVLTMNLLNCYCTKDNSAIYDYLLSKFGWLRNLSETNFGGNLSFASIVKYGLYNEREILKHIYKCPYPIAKMLSVNNGTYPSHIFLKIWKETKKVLIKIENLKPEFLKSPYFFDTTKMAATLGKKVNCSWGLKRLKEEHDKYFKEIIEVVLEFEELKQLNIRKVYRDFAEFSGFELLETNHDLISEGKKMHHCVGTYSPTVNNGSCAIYRYKGHTLDLRYMTPYSFKSSDDKTLKKKKLEINQFMGYNNVSAPKELRDEVFAIVTDFNLLDNEYESECVRVDDFWVENQNDLPF